MYVEKGTETMFILKMQTYKVDEIDSSSQIYKQIFIYNDFMVLVHRVEHEADKLWTSCV